MRITRCLAPLAYATPCCAGVYLIDKQIHSKADRQTDRQRAERHQAHATSGKEKEKIIVHAIQIQQHRALQRSKGNPWTDMLGWQQAPYLTYCAGASFSAACVG